MEFYVSTQTGNDNNGGTFGNPFKTLEKAKQAVKDRILINNVTNIKVYIRGGTYNLDTTLEFDGSDSMLNNIVSWEAYNNEVVNIHGGLYTLGNPIQQTVNGKACFVYDLPTNIDDYYLNSLFNLNTGERLERCNTSLVNGDLKRRIDCQTTRVNSTKNIAVNTSFESHNKDHDGITEFHGWKTNNISKYRKSAIVDSKKCIRLDFTNATVGTDTDTYQDTSKVSYPSGWVAGNTITYSLYAKGATAGQRIYLAVKRKDGTIVTDKTYFNLSDSTFTRVNISFSWSGNSNPCYPIFGTDVGGETYVTDLQFEKASSPTVYERNGIGTYKFKLSAGEITDSMNLDHAYLYAWFNWNTMVKPIAYCKNNEIEAIDGTYAYKDYLFNNEKGTPYYIENVKEYLTREKTWYVSVREKKVYYIPTAQEITVNPSLGIPKLAKFAKFTNAKNIKFKGIRFKYTDWGGDAVNASLPMQSAYNAKGTIDLVSSSNIDFEYCKFLHVGSYGLTYLHSANNKVLNSEIFDSAIGGILVTSGNGNTFNNNEIHNFGRVIRQGCGVLVLGNPGNTTYGGSANPDYAPIYDTTINNNEIYDLVYTGISFGWNWSYYERFENTQFAAPRTTVNGNHIYNIGCTDAGVNTIKYGLSDGAGIYILGNCVGSKITNNIIHDVYGEVYMNGIYFDSGTSKLEVADNVIYNVSDWTITARGYNGSRENKIHNNLFIGSILLGLCNDTAKLDVTGIDSKSEFYANTIVTTKEIAKLNSVKVGNVFTPSTAFAYPTSLSSLVRGNTYYHENSRCIRYASNYDIVLGNFPGTGTDYTLSELQSTGKEVGSSFNLIQYPMDITLPVSIQGYKEVNIVSASTNGDVNVSLIPRFDPTTAQLTNKIAILKNETYQYELTLYDIDGNILDNSNYQIVWSTSDNTIATIDQSGLLTTLKSGSVTVTASVGGVVATSSVAIHDFKIITETQSSSLSSFGTYSFDVDGNKYGFVQVSIGGYQATDILTLEYSTDQNIWSSLSVSNFVNNGYCRINTTNDYHFRFKVDQSGTISYSETLNTTSFYKTPVLTGTKWYFINKNLHLRTEVVDKSVDDLVQFEYSTDQNGQWTELNSIYLGWNVYQTDFDEVGKSGIYYTRSKIVRPANTFYSDVDSIDLDSLGAKNIVGYDPFLPKTPTWYKDAKIGFRVGSVKLGQTYEEPKSILKLGLQKLGVNTLGTYVSIDIKLNTTVSLTRYWSNQIEVSQVYDLLQFYSNRIDVNVNYDLIKVEVLKLLAQIQPELNLQFEKVKDIKIRVSSHPEITIESLLKKEHEISSDMKFDIEIESM